MDLLLTSLLSRPSFTGHSLGQHGFAIARRSKEQDAPWGAAHTREQRWILHWGNNDLPKETS